MTSDLASASLGSPPANAAMHWLRDLARRLNRAKSAADVGSAARDAADHLFTWDSFDFDLYVPDFDKVARVALFDVVDGKRVEVAPPSRNLTPSAAFREIISCGPKLILRANGDHSQSNLTTFGDTNRRSASLMFVPLRDGIRAYGVIGFHSYTSNAYSQRDLEVLELIADQCCGALMRIETEKDFRSIFENSLDGICRITPSGMLLSANTSLARLVGFESVDHFIKSVENVQKLFLAGDTYRLFREKVQEKGLVADFETEFRHEHGHTVWVSVAAHVELDDNGGPLFFETTIQDITDRKSSQRELARMEALYRSAIHGAGGVSYATDYKSRSYTFIDQGIQDLIGYAPEEMRPAIWGEIVKKREMMGEVAGLTPIEAGERVRNGELKHWRCDMLVTSRNGKPRWISDASVQHRDRDGALTGSVGILLDITERKQSEIMALGLAKLSQGLSTATNAEAAAEVISEVSHKLFSWDAFWVKLYNPRDNTLYRILSIDTVDGKQVRDESRTAQRATGLNDRVLKNGAELILRDEPESMRPDAIPFGDKSRPSAAIMTVPIRYRDKVVGTMSAQSYTARAYDHHDLDTFQMLANQCGGALERIWADEALRESEMQFRLVWEASVDGMRLATEDGVVFRVNEAYCRMVGKPRAELEGKLLTEIHLPENRERVLQKHKLKFKGRTPEHRLEKQVTLWHQKAIWFEMSNSLLELPGRPALLLSILRDIGERKQAEAELRLLNKQLIASSRSAGMAEVASGVLHNVGNVLNSVNVAANLVAERLRNSRCTNLKKVSHLLDEHAHDLPRFFASDTRATQLPDYIRKLSEYLSEEQELTLKDIGALGKNIDHIKDIVAMQQSYAKVSGLVELHSVQELVEDALQMNAAALVRHDVSLQKKFEVNPSIVTDKHKVLQILVNFIRNAKYACDEGKKMEKQVIVSIKACSEDRIQISVTDNGSGIPEANLTRIFSHGFTTREGGHGFGLHSSALAAKELGGQILVHSDGPGEGATFTLELPTKFDPTTTL